MKNIPFSDIRIDNGFWKVKQDMIRATTVHAVYDRFAETHRFDALRCKWAKEGRYEGHIFWDSDAAKWVEGAAYLLKQQPDAGLEKQCDEIIEQIIANADENGYFNSYYLTIHQDARFTNRDHHELYCAGHLMEAAIAYRDATGKDAFLKAMCRYADYIEKAFKLDRSAAFVTPGHPELELALMRLYHATGERRYLELAKFFIDMHGCNQSDTHTWGASNYNQDISPLRSISTAEGHCVRALYLYCGMIDLAMELGDEELKDACRRCFDNIYRKRMYITGSVGSTRVGEAFTIDYHLPNRTAYAETCAAIALAMFAGRMQTLEPDSRYADTVERAIYNGVLSGVSMDGKAFFYENPLDVDPAFNHINPSTVKKEQFPITERVEVFDCSCCPPNIVRFIPSIAGMAYSCDDDTIYVHQYIESQLNSGSIRLTAKTNYPANGEIAITCSSDLKYLALRIPGWCQNFRLSCPYEMRNGYAYIPLKGETAVTLTLDMPVVVLAANPKVHENAGRVAVTRGPIVYCIEGIDNPTEDLHSLKLDTDHSFELLEADYLVPSIRGVGYIPKATESLYYPINDAWEQIPVKLIPYFAFANRGTSEMLVWILQR